MIHIRKLFIILIPIIISSIISIYIHYIPVIKQYGTIQINKFNQLIISHSLGNDLPYNELLTIEKNTDNEITSIHFHMNKLNTIASSIVQDLENTYILIETKQYIAKDNSYYEQTLQEVSRQGITASLPVLSLFKIDIPIHYHQITYVGSNVVKNIENYGMNHIMVEIYVELNINITMTYPFFKEYQTSYVEVPLLLEIYEGQIPSTYITKETK